VIARRALTGLAILALLAGCRASEPRHSARVDPRNYDSFFLWGGVRAPGYLDRARTVYILAGEIRRGDPLRLVLLQPAPPRARQPELWLTVRAERLDWGEGVYGEIDRLLAQWAGAGNRVAGLQVDFDAATRGLEDYRTFLTKLRSRLPKRYGLSVTGLMDWSANGDPAVLAGLVGVVDEVVVQTYQGTRTIPGYARYFRRIARLPVPHRVALVEGGEWSEPPELANDPQFRGYVVFLIKH